MNFVDSISAASTPNTVGDNVVMNKLLNLRDHKIFDKGRSTFTDYYANFVGEIGLETQRANNLYDSNKILLADIEARRDSVSGVSLDEEASNMLKWQTAFAASSKIITTIDEMLETVLSLKR